MKKVTKPFNLEEALKGKPVVTGDGRPVSQITLFECKDPYPVIAVVSGDMKTFTREGHHLNNEPSELDLFMVSTTRLREGWVAIWNIKDREECIAGCSNVFPTEEAVKGYGFINATYHKIVWEEEVNNPTGLIEVEEEMPIFANPLEVEEEVKKEKELFDLLDEAGEASIVVAQSL